MVMAFAVSGCGGSTAAAVAASQPAASEPAVPKAAPTTVAALATAEPSATAAETPNVPNATGVLGVDHVGLTFTDLEASKAMFVELFGFRVRGEDKKYPAYFLTNDLTTITLWRAKDPANAVKFNRRDNVGLHHLALGAASFAALDALHERLRNYPGVVIEFAPELAYGGPAKHMMFREPSGNRIELVHRPKP